MKIKIFEKKTTDEMLGEFINGVVKLQPEEFIGLASMMNIKVVNDEKKPIPAEDLIVEVCNSFVARPLRQQKNLLKLVKDATKLRALPKYNEEEMMAKEEAYEKWLVEQKQKIMEEANGTPTEDRKEE